MLSRESRVGERLRTTKGKNREYAKKSYYKHHDKNKKKNIVNQIRRGSQPKQETLEKYGLSEERDRTQANKEA